jgi:tRNA(Ile)-lysidine synthase
VSAPDRSAGAATDRAGAALLDAITSSGLVEPGSGGVILLSGGPDSAALAFGLARAGRGGLVGSGSLLALHVNYGLRPDSGEGEEAAAALCDRLGIELVVERPDRGSGNLHAWARAVRYDAGEALREARGLDWVAVAHTRSDLAETVIYRLATSPGTRALATMPGRRGRVIRPLLGLTRAEVRDAVILAGLPFVDDRSNDDPVFARARIRNEVLPVLEGLNPAVLRAVAETRAELGEELDLIGELAGRLLGDSPTVSAEVLAAAHPALRRHALRLLAERGFRRPVPVSRDQAAEVMRLAGHPEGGEVDLGGGASLAVESGVIFTPVRDPEPDGPISLDLPNGRGDWGHWSLEAEPMEPPFSPEGPDVATLDVDLLGKHVEVRAWREGDRMRPLGMDGSKTLQDLFTDAGVRRSQRGIHPVVTSADGQIAWVPGLAVAEPFRMTPDTRRAVRISARPIRPQASA